MALVCWLVSPTARAQEDTFYLDRLQLAGAPDDGFASMRPFMSDKTRFYGSATLGYMLNALRSESATANSAAENAAGHPMRHQIVTYLGAGVELVHRFGIELMLPIAWVQSGSDTTQYDIGTGLQDGTAVYDFRLGLRLLAWESDDRDTRLGLGGIMMFPTGNAERFASDGATSTYVYGGYEHDFGDFLFVVTAGPQFRPIGGIDGDNGDLRIGSELRTVFGAFLDMRENIRLGGEIFGNTGLQEVDDQNTFFSSRNTSYEWLASIRYRPLNWERTYLRGGLGTRFTAGYGAPDFRLLLQIGHHIGVKDVRIEQRAPTFRGEVERPAPDRDTDGDGYPDDIDACPTIPEDGKPPRPTDGCPYNNDRDGDGIIDVKDKCPDDPEDKDGIQDEDGCPEDDADNDAIPDAQDACPLKPGVESANPKRNGCPESKHKKIVEEDGQIRLLEPIEFETARATIKPVSFPILDEVVDVMKTRDTIKIAVHGHTDNRGAHAYNMRLSDQRAASVVRYLVGKGIDKGRLESEGFGPDKPKDTNDTDEGRARNRRVEFKIIGE